ncbi:CrcB family protein [Arthrobacter sp. BE255]|uniref:fluoride efflux transporter FluC n=1 Tax=Arthrobacter sp. BE255 TaxID=2817721 RepID=UPI002863DA35|nr:CrcB family protein [Arthrobacter sp. BE255]MDR7157777.1 CrcB protein [Arthrobacter sp. BE255]
MSAAILVGVFGVAGALLRFAVDSWFARRAGALPVRSATGAAGHAPRHWPWATLAVNVAGCLVIGLSVGITGRLGLPEELHTAVATGLAGGLTTFSSWTTATIRLLSESRFGAAALNVAANLLVGFAAAAAGIAIVS